MSIIDLETGWQPIHNEDKSLWIVFNGEIFNYVELRRELKNRGHQFYTHSDTEVLIHLYEEKGEDFLHSLNGQFSIAIYNKREESLFLARDRLGIRPLFYTSREGKFYFASEIKAIFSADAAIPREIDPQVLSEIFTFWMPSGEDTIFSGVKQLGAGQWIKVSAGGAVRKKEYWDIPLGLEEDGNRRSEDDLAEELRELLIDSVRLRLRADVPVGAYLSGGIDSSTITSIVRNFTNNPLKTFSVTFSDKVFDERKQQQEERHRLETKWAMQVQSALALGN